MWIALPLTLLSALCHVIVKQGDKSIVIHHKDKMIHIPEFDLNK